MLSHAKLRSQHEAIENAPKVLKLLAVAVHKNQHVRTWCLLYMYVTFGSFLGCKACLGVSIPISHLDMKADPMHAMRN